MRLLFLGDVVGRAGRRVVAQHLPDLKGRLKPDLVILNGENAAGGFGVTEPVYHDLLEAGADVVTLGNHAFDQREALVFIERVDGLIRPLNFPTGTPGKGAVLATAGNGARVLVLNALGRIFMDPLDDPFAALDRELEACPLGAGADAIVVDFHAEATSEKQALATHVDGRVSLFVGTHTHVPTADYRVLPNGTGYITDIGMCGDYDSVIGMDKNEPLHRFLHKIPSSRFEPASGDASISGVLVDVGANGLATGIWPVRTGGHLDPVIPQP